MTAVKTKLRDINIYVIDGVMNVIPYRLKLEGVDFYVDTYNVHPDDEVLKVKMDKRSHATISHILNLEEWEMRGSWEEFDDWDTTESLTTGTPPDKIAKWLKKLPEYEIVWEDER